MKKKLIATLIVLIALGVLFVGTASAADETTAYPTPYCTSGERIGRGGIHGSLTGGYGSGVLHDYVVSAAADQLDLTESEVEEALDDGTTLCQLAIDNGIADEDLEAFLTDIHETALVQAVSDGVLSAEQADWMSQRRALRGTGGAEGMGRGHGGLGDGTCLRSLTP